MLLRGGGGCIRNVGCRVETDLSGNLFWKKGEACMYSTLFLGAVRDIWEVPGGEFLFGMGMCWCGGVDLRMIFVLE